MNVDEAARRSAAAVLAQTRRQLDVDLMRSWLDVARRRRGTAVAATVTGVVVLALLLGTILVGRGRGTPLPAPAVRHTTVSVTPHAEELLLAGLYADSFSVTPPTGCEYPSVAFSADGGRLAYACPVGSGAGTWVLDVPDGIPRRVAGPGSGVTWTADGSALVVAADAFLEIVHLDGNAALGQPLRLPSGWLAGSVDAGPGDRLVLGGAVNLQSAIMTIGVDGSRPQVIRRTTQVTLMEPRWSPDGGLIGFVQRDAPPASATVAPASVRTVRATGSGQRFVHALEPAAFIGRAPSLDWSPQGRLAFVTSEKGANVVVVLRPDGTLDEIRPATPGPVAWRRAG